MGDAERAHEPLVLHVIPTAVARGGQIEARAMADQLDEPGVRRHQVLCLFDGPDDVRVEHSLRHPGGEAAVRGFRPGVVLELRRALQRLAPAVVLAHGGDPLKYLVPAMTRSRVPLVYYAIGTITGGHLDPVRHAMWKFLMNRPVVVGAEGEEVLAECRQRFGVPDARSVFTPNGRDPEEFHPGPSSTGHHVPVLTFVGALTTQKRPDRFIALVAALRARGISLVARLVGDGPIRESLEGPATDAAVELLGRRHDIAELLRDTDLFVFPSLWAGEGMPGVLIEAGLSGVPVVAAETGGVRTIVRDGETGVIVGVDDFDAMVDAAASLAMDPERRRAMAAAARAHCVEHFSVSVVAATWRGILDPLARPNWNPQGRTDPRNSRHA
jgi:glycosyltransferase involved in cell wall biosynthesis